MKTVHRLILLSICLILGIYYAQATSEARIDGVTYELREDIKEAYIHGLDLGNRIDYTIPNKITVAGITYKVTKIYRGFRDNTIIQKVTISKGILILGSQLFKGCTSLINVQFPDTIQECGTMLFDGCTSLKNVTIPHFTSATHNQVSFNGCSNLEEVRFLQNNFSFLPSFTGCINLKRIYFNTTSVISPKFDKSVDISKLTIYVPNKETVKAYKNQGWSLFRVLKEGSREFYFHFSIISEEDHTLEINKDPGNDSIPPIYSLPSTFISDEGNEYQLKQIGVAAHIDCNNIVQINIPSSISYLSEESFTNCSSVKEIYIKNTIPPICESNIFKDLNYDCILYVPKNYKNVYKSATYWNTFVNILEEGEEMVQPSDLSDATLKSLSYKIGNDGPITPVPNFSPDVYRYEIGYRSNEEAMAEGQSAIYPEGTHVYPTGVATNEKAQVLPSDMLLPYGFVKVGVASEDKSTERTYSLFMMSEKDAGKKYYVMMNLEHMTVQINGTTYKNGDIYKANHNENITVKLIPAQGYKLPSSIQIDEGSSISFLELGQTSEINLREINWHMGLSASAVENTGQGDNNIFVHDNLKYRITANNTVSVVGPDVAEGSGTQGNDNDSWTIADCVIPSTITHNSIAYQVKAIEDRAFSGAINMKTITLPEGLETIGYEAFYRCYELKTLHIPASVTSIKVKEDEIFFSKLDIESISVASDNKVYASLDGLLYNKSMTTLLFCPYFDNNREITLPEGVTTLRQYVFAYQDSLISVTLPESLKSIGNYAFYQCDGLVNIHLKGQQPPLAGESAFESSKLVHLIAYVPKGYKNAYTDWGIFLPENIIEEGSEEEADTFIEGLFKYRKLTENTVAVIGSTITGNACDIISPVTHNNKTYQVTEIGDEAFSGLNIEKGSIPEGIRKIGSKAYENCALLEYMILPSSIEEIKYEAFNGCKKLKRIQLNDGLKYIGDDAFNNTALTSIQIPASVIEIENLCEDCPSLMGIDVDSKNTYYSSEGGILYDKKQTVMLMVPQAYAGDIFSLPETLKSIDVGAFYKCKDIKTIDLPEGIEIIGECAFSLCGATSITLPSSLKQLDMCVFGDHREAIGVLKELHSKHTDPAKIKIESNTFAYVIDFNTCKLYVPKGCKAKYQAAEGWKEFKQIIEEGDNLPLIPDKTDDEITLNTDSTYTDGEGNTGHFNGMIGNGEEETAINKLTIRGSASSTTTTIVINKVTVGNGSSTSETTTSVTKNTNVVIELIGDNSLGKVVNDGIAKLIRKVEAALKNTVVINNGIFVDETGLLTRVEGAAELDITAPSDQEVRPGENVTLTASTKISVTYAVTFIWEQLQPDGTWKAVGSPNVYTPARSGLRSATTVTDRLTIDAKDAGKYRCVIRNKVGNVSSTLTTPPATVTAKSTVDIVTPKSYRKVTPCGNQLHFEISTPTEVKIINLNGALIRSISLPAGDTYIDGLDKGVYILLFEDGVTQKVRI